MTEDEPKNTVDFWDRRRRNQSLTSIGNGGASPQVHKLLLKSIIFCDMPFSGQSGSSRVAGMTWHTWSLEDMSAPLDRDFDMRPDHDIFSSSAQQILTSPGSVGGLSSGRSRISKDGVDTSAGSLTLGGRMFPLQSRELDRVRFPIAFSASSSLTFLQDLFLLGLVLSSERNAPHSFEAVSGRTLKSSFSSFRCQSSSALQDLRGRLHHLSPDFECSSPMRVPIGSSILVHLCTSGIGWLRRKQASSGTAVKGLSAQGTGPRRETQRKLARSTTEDTLFCLVGHRRAWTRNDERTAGVTVWKSVLRPLPHYSVASVVKQRRRVSTLIMPSPGAGGVCCEWDVDLRRRGAKEANLKEGGFAAFLAERQSTGARRHIYARYRSGLLPLMPASSESS
ncbi:hypothetical protein C8F01DRAFT_1077714 [Mycena amicta]|nr:hypothetical protein C8F01DRAFT_1077714 [Mycena amicta]